MKAHLLGHNPRREGIAKAAWQLEDAINDRLVKTYPSNLQARDLHFQVSQAEQEYRTALLLMILLTMFETPSWCNTKDNFFTYVDPSVRCTINKVDDQYILLSDLPYIPPGWAIAIELMLLIVIGRKLLLERKLQIHFFKPLCVEYNSLEVSRFGMIMVGLELLDCIMFVIFRPNFRIVFLARTGYLSLLPAVRNLCNCITKVIERITFIAAILVGTIVFFTWVTVTIFEPLEDQVFGDNVNKGLDSFRSTFYTLFVSGSTEDFVDCFLPSYTKYRVSGALWLLFLLIVQVLLLNLVLDTLVSAYKRYCEDTNGDSTLEKVEGIVQAFKTLTKAAGTDDEVCMETFHEFTRELGQSPCMRPIDDKTAQIIFQTVDQDKGGTVNEGEFCDICGVIEYDFWTTPTNSPVETVFPWLWNSAIFQQFRDWVKNEQFAKFMNYVLIVNLVLVIVESAYDMYKKPETPLMENLELCFSCVYVMEVGLQLCVYDFRYYWSDRSNQFDFATTWLLLASSVLDDLASTNGMGNIKRYMNILRLFRLLRVLKQLKKLKEVQFMVKTISSLVTRSKDILTLLGVVTFFFSSLSVQLWGGLLYETNPLLDETEYKEKRMYVLNFNDFLMSFGVWVVMLLCEYVPIFPEAIANASSIPGSWLVFVGFYLMGVSIVFELVKAFTIEVFLDLKKKNQGKGDEETEFSKSIQLIRDQVEEDGLTLHCRIVGDLTSHEKITTAYKEKKEAEGKMEAEEEKPKEEEEQEEESDDEGSDFD